MRTLTAEKAAKAADATFPPLLEDWTELDVIGFISAHYNNDDGSDRSILEILSMWINDARDEIVDAMINLAAARQSQKVNEDLRYKLGHITQCALHKMRVCYGSATPCEGTSEMISHPPCAS